ncbi:conserved hypothetical protein [Nitrosospira sp. Nsp14]|nr:conserved hypothetical protein [Nitrosospira sp. Nsp14]
MQSDEQEIRQLVSTWMAASKAGDVETVLSLMADDVIFLMSGAGGDAQSRLRCCCACSIGTGEQRRPAIRRQKRNTGDQGSWGLGLYVDKAYCHRYLAQRRAIHDSRRLYAIHSQETEGKVAAGARCQHARSRIKQMIFGTCSWAACPSVSGAINGRPVTEGHRGRGGASTSSMSNYSFIATSGRYCGWPIPNVG